MVFKLLSGHENVYGRTDRRQTDARPITLSPEPFGRGIKTDIHRFTKKLYSAVMNDTVPCYLNFGGSIGKRTVAFMFLFNRLWSFILVEKVKRSWECVCVKWVVWGSWGGGGQNSRGR